MIESPNKKAADASSGQAKQPSEAEGADAMHAAPVRSRPGSIAINAASLTKIA